jgi:hypothetical protein
MVAVVTAALSSAAALGAPSRATDTAVEAATAVLIQCVFTVLLRPCVVRSAANRRRHGHCK